MTTGSRVRALRASGGAGRLLAHVVAVSVGASCAVVEVAPPAVVTRDSAGVEIVEIAGSSLAGLPEWRLEDEPLLTIGDAGPEGSRHFPGAGNVVSFDDGGFAAVNSATREIWFFDSAGRFEAAAGGVGSEPGRFVGTPLVHVDADGGVIVVDREAGRHRLTRFLRDGTLSATQAWSPEGCDAGVSAEGPAPICLIPGALSDGTVVYAYLGPPSSSAPDGSPRLHDVLGVRSPDGVYRTVASPLYPADWTLDTSGGDRVRASGPLLSSAPLYAVGRTRFGVTFRDRYEIQLFRADGALERIVRVALPDEPITEGERTLLADPRGVADHRPKISATGLRIGDDGTLWVPDFRFSPLTGDQAPQRFTVFDPAGRPIARMTVASGLLLLGFRADRLLGAVPVPGGGWQIQVFGVVR